MLTLALRLPAAAFPQSAHTAPSTAHSAQSARMEEEERTERARSAHNSTAAPDFPVDLMSPGVRQPAAALRLEGAGTGRWGKGEMSAG